MRLVSYRGGWGVLEGSEVVELGASPDAIGRLDSDALRAAVGRAARRLQAEGLVWEPPVARPGKILCIGVNYEMHREETGRAKVGHPTVFTRFASTLVGHEGALVRPRVSESLDFEGELAVIIGRPGRSITRAAAWAHIAGYACFNDASVRDWQRHTSQFTPGKNFPGTGGFGPWMVTADEIAPDELPGLGLRTRINGTVVQEAKLGEMIFDVPTLIEYCSTFCELLPGDVIATGTPGGVGERRQPPLWLRPGDVVEVEIDRVGLLRNRVVAEA